ncbi:hypothetical protein MNBD_GAMMA15-2253 [hydrothermal vent metagenome]|uniref:DUF3106 domain-containing protein n=1 Tax=hydrothermal vent metagenome TaxID=652676 RepID=A0A3B0Y5X4_9ZZZZ
MRVTFKFRFTGWVLGLLLLTPVMVMAEQQSVPWNTLSETEQDVLKPFAKRWKAMPPEQRKAMRERHERFRKLPPEQQQRLCERRQWFQELPQERREALRNKWRTMSPGERKRFRDKHRP